MKSLLVGLAVYGMALASSFALTIDKRDVPSGSATVTDLVTHDEETLIEKTGVGCLVLPASVVDQRADLNVQVDEGTLELQADGAQPPAAAELSDAVRGKMALWLSVKDATHLVPKTQGGADIEYWYDVRESDVASPTHVYAQASHLQTENGPRLVVAESPSYRNTVVDKMDALYFGGYKSGVSMDLMAPNATKYKTVPMEVVAVHGVVDSWGYLFGGSHTDGELPVIEGDYGLRSISSGYAWNHCWGAVMGDARIWVDGIEVPRSTPVHRGFHLLHRRRNTINMKSYSQELALYSYGSKTGGNADSWRKGGDYLSEVMYFTNTLTTAERLEVQNYLMRKWFGKQTPMIDVALADGAKAEVNSASGVTELDFRARGAGSLVKKGEGTLLYRPTHPSAENPATLDLEAGKVFALRALPVAVQPGDGITAERYYVNRICHTARVSRVANAYAADTVVKDGNSSVTFTDIPNGVKRLQVKGGSMTLRPTARTSRKYEVAIPNGGFEDWTGYGTDKATVAVGTDASVAGWAQGGQYAYLYDYDVWMDATQKGESDRYGAIGGKITSYALDAARPPEGSCALFLTRETANAYTTVTIPEDGEYELTLWLWARTGYSENGNLRATLKSADGNEVAADFGLTTFISKSGSSKRLEWFQYALRATAKAGTYRLCIANEWNSTWGEQNNNITLVVDDLHLYRVGDYVKEYKIPGGDFEPVGEFAKWAASPSAMSSALTVKGWTFDSADWLGGSKTEYYPSLGVVNSWMKTEQGRGEGNGYNGGTRPRGGEYQLLVRKPNADNTAHTTFAPPAGKWYLTCRAAIWCDYSTPKIHAVATAGGKSVDLGDVEIDNSFDMKDYVWEIPFEADGSDVTLDIAYVDTGDAAYHGVSVDDFRLIAEYKNDKELVANGDFELPYVGNTGSAAARSGWSAISAGSSSSWAGRAYGDSLSSFGTDYASGTVFGEIYGLGGVYQNIRLPHAGWYRLSFLVKGRAYWDPCVKDVAVELVSSDLSSTNRIGVVSEACNATYEQRTMAFRVEESGAYRLVFRNLWENSNAYTCLDDVSLRYVGEDGEGEVSLPSDLKINLGADVRLRLDFAATNTVKGFKANGVSYRGLVNKDNCPAVEGEGSLFAEPDGMILLFR